MKDPLKKTIREAFLKALDTRLSSQPDFKSRDPRGTGTAQEMETAFRAATDLLVAIAIKRSLLAD